MSLPQRPSSPLGHFGLAGAWAAVFLIGAGLLGPRMFPRSPDSYLANPFLASYLLLLLGLLIGLRARWATSARPPLTDAAGPALPWPGAAGLFTFAALVFVAHNVLGAQWANAHRAAVERLLGDYRPGLRLEMGLAGLAFSAAFIAVAAPLFVLIDLAGWWLGRTRAGAVALILCIAAVTAGLFVLFRGPIQVAGVAAAQIGGVVGLAAVPAVHGAVRRRADAPLLRSLLSGWVEAPLGWPAFVLSLCAGPLIGAVVCALAGLAAEPGIHLGLLGGLGAGGAVGAALATLPEQAAQGSTVVTGRPS